MSWIDFCELFGTVFLPPNNQECIWRCILERIQGPEEALPTFVAHMLGEFKKLRSPLPEREQVEVICRHAEVKYRVVLYGAPVRSAIDLMLRAHELHSVLSPSTPQVPPSQVRKNPDVGTYCF